MALTANWSYPTSIRFGAGRINELAEACETAGIKKPLLVTDRNLATLPITQNVLDLLDENGLGRACFSDVDPNPTDTNLAQGLERYRQGKHDGVIAFGGGSGLDLGKTIAFMSGQERPVWDFEDIGDYWSRAKPEGIAPIIAVPTTAGTGAEVGRAGVIVNSFTHEKKIIFHPLMLPKIVLADPALTIGMPPAITAGTGMDAFAHCLEAYCSPHYHPMSQGIAVEGMRLVKDNLHKAYTTGDDLQARGHMMSAAMMGATAFQKGLGAIHALSHPLGAIYNTHHGTTNAVVMLPVLHFNRPAIESRIERLTRYLGIEAGYDGFCAWVATMNQSLGIPENLQGLGIEQPNFEELTEAALADPSCGGNPVPMTSENTLELLKSCFN